MKIYVVIDGTGNPVLSQFYTTQQYAQSALDSFPKDVPIFADYAIKEIELQVVADAITATRSQIQTQAASEG